MMQEQGVDMTQHHFEAVGPIRLRVEVMLGDVRVQARDADGVEIRLIPRGKGAESVIERFTVEQRGDEVVVTAPKFKDPFFGWANRGQVDVEVDLPRASSIDVKCGSGDVVTVGALARVVVGTGAGDISVDEAEDGDVKSGSGDLDLPTVRGNLLAKTGSGDIRVGSSHGPLDLASGSGDVTVVRAESDVRVKTGSGDITVTASAADIDVLTGTGDVVLGGIHGGEIRVRTGTGDVTFGVVTGVAAYLDLNTVTGDVSIDLDEAGGPEDTDATASLSLHSGSGDVHVKRAHVSMS